ncbi:MAG TPA: DUF92 domain-containing protein, partial [Segetibacter sp.]
AAICGLSAEFLPEYSTLLQLAIAGSFAAASADTVSSELGNVYGSRYYNIITFKKDRRGLDGVVSLEGTLAGIVASALIAIIYYLFFRSFEAAFCIVLAGAIGNIVDSVLGAILERKNKIGNNMVNFSNTVAGALVAVGLYLVAANT